MTVGNKKTNGSKGTNFPFQHKVLQGLEQLLEKANASNLNTGNLEALMSQLLAVAQTSKDFETLFVRDDNGDTWLEIRTLDEDTGTWTIAYFLPGDLTSHQLQPGDPSGPLGPLTYFNTSATLIQILSEVTTIRSNMINFNTGSITTGIISPTLPYSIPDDTYNSFTIVITGVVTIDTISVPAGSYTFSAPASKVLTGKALAGAGSVIILTQTN